MAQSDLVLTGAGKKASYACSVCPIARDLQEGLWKGNWEINIRGKATCKPFFIFGPNCVGVGVYFKTALLRFNSHIIQFTHLK